MDGLRAIAVLLVLFFHQEVLPFGWVGVQNFFVLSGYLITRSLYHTRSLPISQYLKVFYGRRSLRIFPLYFGVCGLFAIAVALGARPGGVAQGLPYALTYTYNFWHASSSFVHSKLITHFWSLCVEEQFYLFWPFVIFFCPQRLLRGLLIGIVAAGPLLRIISYQLLSIPQLGALPDTSLAVYVLTTSHIDAFAVGAFVSLYPIGGNRKAALSLFAAIVVTGLLVVAFADKNASRPANLGTVGYPLGLPDGYAYVWGYSLLNLFSAVLIDCIVVGKFAPRFLNNALLQHIGKVSYGYYVMHYPVQSVVAHFIHQSLVLQILVQIVATTLLATASFYAWENQFLKLKDRWFAARPALSAART